MLKNKKNFFLRILIINLLYFVPINSNATIVTILKPLGFIAAAIADKVTSVKVIVPDGKTIHNYSLRPLDVIKIKNSDFVVLIGNNVEPLFLKKIINHFKKKSIELTTVKKIKLLLIDSFKSLKKTIPYTQHERNSNSMIYDMHVWLSPQIAIESATIIHDMLIKTIPQKKTLIDSNLKTFKVHLFKLNQNIKKNLASIREKKYFIFHDAYQYFEKYYNLKPLGYINKYPGVQIGARSLYDIKVKLLAKKALCIFTEPQFNSNIINVITRGTSIRQGILDPLGIHTPLGKDSYLRFLLTLSNQYISCLQKPQGIK